LYTGDKNVKVVFIAGALHLITPIHQQNNPNVNLSSLYDELDYGEHRAAILIPPHVLASLVPRLGQDEEKE
jgi:hypothetical protein